MTDLVGNSEDRVSHNEAQMVCSDTEAGKGLKIVVLAKDGIFTISDQQNQ